MNTTISSQLLLLLLTLLSLFPSHLTAQENKNPITEYELLFRDLKTMRIDPSRAATVRDFTLRREVASFDMQEGVVYLCLPVNGRVCGALFIGKGILSFDPVLDVERQQLYRFYGKNTLQERFEKLFILFADSTGNELGARLRFSQAANIQEAQSELESSLDFFCDQSSMYLATEITKTFLDRLSNSLFYAHVATEDLDDLFFEIDPFSEEQVALMRVPKKSDSKASRETISQLNQQGSEPTKRSTSAPEFLRVNSYKIDCSISDKLKLFDSHLSFHAVADVRLTSLMAGQKWFYLALYRYLDVDSVFWADGRHATFFRGKKNEYLWVKTPQPLDSGSVVDLKVFYGGRLIDGSGTGWCFLESPTGWYPHAGRGKSLFEVTFTTPSKYSFVCVGRNVLRESTEEVTKTVWVTPTPVKQASFNIGVFKEYKRANQQSPAVTVYINERAHEAYAQNLIKAGIPTARLSMEKQVDFDISGAITYFENLFGKCQTEEFSATEIPYSHGQAFPGLVHLSWVTFQSTSIKGYDNVFRAHEVAHQWWGIGVGYKTYHDQWLSEGFADYCGLMYTRLIGGSGNKFEALLKEWREEILNNRQYIFGSGQQAGPIWLGYRTESSDTPGDYDLIIYKKGAWVLHMLRMMLTDLNTMDDAKFKAMMREFFMLYDGKDATTEDFRKVVAKYTGEDMEWFFKQWVYGTQIPKYRFAYKLESLGDQGYKATCRVEQSNVNKDFQMYVPVTVDFGDEGTGEVRILVKGPLTETELPLLPMKPRKILLNEKESVLCEVETTSW